MTTQLYVNYETDTCTCNSWKLCFRL